MVFRRIPVAEGEKVSVASGAAVRAALRHASARSGLFAEGQTLVVAYSGGQDSTCLLHAVLGGARGKGVSVVAAHVDHGLRPESADDARRVEAIGAALGVRVVARRVEVGVYARSARRWSVQHAARAARYQALAAVCAEVGSSRLLLAHTADDQAETLLLNLLRGTGLAGLGGMRLEDSLDPTELGPLVPEAATWPALPFSLTLLRPLLAITRAQTLAYCQEVGLEVVLDPTNAKADYTRNRLRQELMPMLERFNPSVRATLARTAELLAEEHEALTVAADRAFHAVLRAETEEELRLDLAELGSLPRALQRRVLRAAIERLAGSLTDVPAGPVEDTLDFLLASGPSEGAYDLPRGIVARRTGTELALRRRGIGSERAEPRV